MQQQIQHWIQQSSLMKTQLELWANSVNQNQSHKTCQLYHPKARLFPTFGALKQSPAEIENYFKEASIASVKIHYGSLSYNTDENLIEGEYTFRMQNDELQSATFAFKFSREGLILEHASAPKNLADWRVRNEVCISTLLTAATVQAVLKRNKALEVIA